MKLILVFVLFSLSAAAQDTVLLGNHRRMTILIPRREADTVFIVSRDTIVVMKESGLTRNIDSYLEYVSNSTNAEPVLRFNHTMPASVGAPAVKTWLQIEPLEKGFGGTPFTISTSLTKYRNDDQGDHVANFGLNLSPGGGQIVPGQPGIGFSLEQNYKPLFGTSLTESHEFYITPAGKQVRLKSFTIDNLTGGVDLYWSADPFYLRSAHNGDVYMRMWSGGLRMFSTDAELWLGDLVLQSLDWKTGRALKIHNGGLQMPALRAPTSTPVPLYIDNAGNVFPKF